MSKKFEVLSRTYTVPVATRALDENGIERCGFGDSYMVVEKVEPVIEFICDEEVIFARNKEEALRAVQEEYKDRTHSDVEPLAVAATAVEDKEYPEGYHYLNCDVYIVSEWGEK